MSYFLKCRTDLLIKDNIGAIQLVLIQSNSKVACTMQETENNNWAEERQVISPSSLARRRRLSSWTCLGPYWLLAELWQILPHLKHIER